MSFKVNFGDLDWGTSDNKMRGRPEDTERAYAKAESMARLLGGHIHISKAGRPYIVVGRGDVVYSVMWLGRYWSVSYPFPSWGAPQTRLSFDYDEEVVTYFGRG